MSVAFTGEDGVQLYVMLDMMQKLVTKEDSLITVQTLNFTSETAEAAREIIVTVHGTNRKVDGLGVTVAGVVPRSILWWT
jgi:hypothetical protein